MEETRVVSRRRWYDSSSVIWKLMGTIAVMLMAFSAIMWGITDQVRAQNGAQDVKIQKVETMVESIDHRQTRMEAKQDKMDEKLDRILERMPR